MRLQRVVLGFVALSILAYGQRVVFTMVTPGTSPVVIASVVSSHDYGFQSLMLLNDSEKTIESIRFRVTMKDEVVDGGNIFAKLEPGDRKSVDVFLGRMSAMTQRARELKLEVARAIVTVESVDFSDGTQWSGDQPERDTPIGPRPIPK
jgi:hypothetical protein